MTTTSTTTPTVTRGGLGVKTRAAPTPTVGSILTAPETIECQVCFQQVGPTREGGTRPRPHNDTDGRPCAGAKRAELPRCGRCGGEPRKPRGACRSRTYHPERWILAECAVCDLPISNAGGKWHHDRTPGDGHDPRPVNGVEVGNIAAAGEIVGVSGQQYGWLTRLKDEHGHPLPSTSPRVAPVHIGVRADGVPYFDLAAVREFTLHRPGPGAPGQPRRRSVVVAGAR